MTLEIFLSMNIVYTMKRKMLMRWWLIRVFKKNDLFKLFHNNGAKSLSVVIIYSIVDSIINAFAFSMRSFNPNRNVSTLLASFRFDKKRLIWFYQGRKNWIIVSRCQPQLQDWTKEYMSNKWYQRPLFRLTVLAAMSCMVENKEVLSTKCFGLDCESFDKSFLRSQNESWPFKTTLCWWFFRKSSKRHNSLSFMPFCLNWYISPLCQTLSKAFDMPRKTILSHYW